MAVWRRCSLHLVRCHCEDQPLQFFVIATRAMIRCRHFLRSAGIWSMVLSFITPASPVLSCDQLSKDSGFSNEAIKVSESVTSAHASLRSCCRAKSMRCVRCMRYFTNCFKCSNGLRPWALGGVPASAGLTFTRQTGLQSSKTGRKKRRL